MLVWVFVCVRVEQRAGKVWIGTTSTPLCRSKMRRTRTCRRSSRVWVREGDGMNEDGVGVEGGWGRMDHRVIVRRSDMMRLGIE